MQRLSWVLLIVLVGAIAVVASRLPWFRETRPAAAPRPVPSGDREIAFLHNPTAFENWDNFVWGVKRAEMAADGAPSGLEVDDANAFPNRTTAVPEITIRKPGCAGALRVRWYKVTDEATQEAWVKALAARDPPPLAILGGWSSDRAKELADVMRETNWSGDRPLLFLVTATADAIDPVASSAGDRDLISLYDRSFRFCFTNRQMADAVTDFVLADPNLRPGSIFGPGFRSSIAAVAGPLAGLTAWTGESDAKWPTLPGYAVEWKDDPYSTDLCRRFLEAFDRRMGSSLKIERFSVPFSTGRMNRPNHGELVAAERILANLPPHGMRTVLIVPSVTAPTRRVLRASCRGTRMSDGKWSPSPVTDLASTPSFATAISPGRSARSPFPW